MKHISLAMIIAASLSQTAWAQPTRSLTPDKMMEIGDASFGQKDTYTALEWYTKAYDADNSNLLAAHQIATMYDQLRDYKQATQWYATVVDKDKNKTYPNARYRYAHTLKLNGQYEEAIKQFTEVEKETTDDRIKKICAIEIEGARWARKYPEQPEPLVIENVGRSINSPSSEDGAFAATRDKIYYSSLKTDTLIYTAEAPEDKKTAKIYYSTRSADGAGWEAGKEFNNSVLYQGGFHAVQPAFTPDKSKFYFVRAKLEGNFLKNSRIYVANNQDDNLSNPVALSFNSNDYSCKNPQVAVMDGKLVLLFSSDKPGGKGGFDIWYAEINADGTTKEPLLIGGNINTIADDITPFFDARESVLYFSSQGHPSVGGFDVFKSKYSAGTYSQPENMGFGFNSRVDDFGFSINQEGNDDCYGYVVSNRPGTISMKSETCCDDVFSVLMPNRCDIIANVNVIDEETKQPLKNATVQLVDKSTGKVIDEQNNKDGNNYTFKLDPNKEYEVVAIKEGFDKPSSQTKLSTLKKDIGEVTKPVTINKETPLKEQLGLVVETYNAKTQQGLNGAEVAIFDAATGAELKKEKQDGKNRYIFPLGRDRQYKIVASREGFTTETRTMTLQQVKMGEMQKVYLTPMELPIFYDVFFDFNRDEIRPSAADTLNRVLASLQQFPNLVVEVRGHADAIGSDSYNDQLSARRSKNAIEWLVAKGIARERFIPRAAGEKEPRAANDNNGVDNPEGRQLNRRVEFKIIDAKDVKPSTTGVTESGNPVAPEVKTDSKKDKMSGDRKTEAKKDKMSGDKNTETKKDKIEKKDEKKK